MMLYEAMVRFFPVGQGLFSYGQVDCCKDGREVLSWVYDCGTMSGDYLVTDKINLLKNKRRSRIDVVFISHFDRDHVSGIVYLLKNFDVSLLVMPYFSSSDVVIQVLLEYLEIGSDALEIAKDPVGFLEKAGLKVGKILLVPSGSGKGNDGNVEEEVIINESDGIEANVRFSHISEYFSNKNPQVYVKSSGVPIKINEIWSFFVHNPDLNIEIPKCLDKYIKIMVPENRAISKSVLCEIKERYAEVFGKSAKNKNIISMFVYGVPDGSVIKQDEFSVNCSFMEAGSNGFDDRGEAGKVGILYTGDGYLKSSGEIKDFLDSEVYAGASKLECFVFQVMHHGVSANFNKNIFHYLSIDFSVVSSDPSRSKPGHPNKSVVFELLQHGFVQVDKNNDFIARLIFFSNP